jgi:hypothetical protein
MGWPYHEIGAFGPPQELTFLDMLFQKMVSRWYKTRFNAFEIGNAQEV